METFKTKAITLMKNMGYINRAGDVEYVGVCEGNVIFKSLLNDDWLSARMDGTRVKVVDTPDGAWFNP